MNTKCVRCHKDLTHTIGIVVMVNGQQLPRVLLCGEHGCNGQSNFTVNHSTCLRCGNDIADNVAVCIVADGRVVPGWLCLDHGSNDADEMTAAEYVLLLIESSAATTGIR